MLLGALLGLAVFCLYLAGHYLILRYSADHDKPRRNVILLVSLLAALAIMASAAASLVADPVLSKGGAILAMAWGCLTYLCLFVVYTPFFYTISASLSVRTIIALSRSPGGRLSIAAILSRFASRELVGRRLETMVVNGFLRNHRDGFALTAKGRRLARTFLGLKLLWRLGAGG